LKHTQYDWWGTDHKKPKEDFEKCINSSRNPDGKFHSPKMPDSELKLYDELTVLQKGSSELVIWSNLVMQMVTIA